MKTRITRNRPGRTISAIASIAVAGIAVSGCTAAGNEDGTTTIVVQQLSQWTNMMDVVIAEFEEANPDIQVETQLVSDPNVNTQVIAGNNPPDVAWVPANSVAYEAALDADALLPLDDVWANQNLDERYGETTALALKASDGKPYLVSINSVFYDVVYYNKALFEEVGAEAPADHRLPDDEALFEIADLLRAGGYQPLSINGKDPAMYGWMVDQLLQNGADEEQMANYLSNYLPSVEVTANYTDAPFVDAVEKVQGWAEAGVFEDGYQGADEPTATALFLQGQAGMVLGGSWMPDDIEAAGIDFGWMLLPGVSDEPVQIPSYRGEAVAVPAGAAHPDEAKRFIEFWMSDDMQEAAVANTNTALPAVGTVDASALDLHEVTQSIVQDVNEFGGPVGWTSTAPGSFSQQVVGANIKLLLLGELTVEEVALAQQAALDEIRSQ